MREFSAQQMMRQMARLKAEIEEHELEMLNTTEPASTSQNTQS
jgi:LPS-assembly lipoprotein